MATTNDSELPSEERAALLRDFYPVCSLWEGKCPLYPSEQSARWAIRQHRRALAEAGAIALHRGRTLVHVSRLTSVMERAALEAARKRYCRTES